MDVSQYTAQNTAQTLLAPKPATAGGTRISDAALTQAKALGASLGAPDGAAATDAKSASAPGGLFEQLLDTVNPLQHLPGVSSLYQSVTGDGKSALSSMAGGFLFGGPVGLAAGAASSFMELVTGKSLLGNLQAMLGIGEDNANADGSTTEKAVSVAADSRGAAQVKSGLSVQQYQAFAETTDARFSGVGANQANIAWADNLWTQSALSQATGLYEQTQTLGGGAAERTRRSA